MTCTWGNTAEETGSGELGDLTWRPRGLLDRKLGNGVVRLVLQEDHLVRRTDERRGRATLQVSSAEIWGLGLSWGGGNTHHGWL